MMIPKLRFKADDGSEFPEWEKFSLGDVTLEFKSGKNIKASLITSNGDYPVYGGNGLRGYTNNFNHDGTYAIIGRQGALCGNMTLVSGKTYLTEHAIAVNGNDKNNTLFLYYLLITMRLGQYSDQGAQPGLAVNKLLKLTNMFPSLPEQQKIASFLSTIDEIIQSTESELTAWQERKKGVMQKIFNREVRFKADDGSEFPEWTVVSLGDVSEFVRNGYSYSSDGSREHCYKLTRIESISDGKINIEKLGSSDKIDEKYLLVDGDILFSNINSLPYLGNVALYEEKFGKIYHGMNLLCIRPCKQKVIPLFLFNELLTFSVRCYEVIHAKAAVNQCSLPASDVKLMPLIVPSLPEQRKIADCLSSLDDVINQIKAELSAWKEFKKGLLQQMFV